MQLQQYLSSHVHSCTMTLTMTLQEVKSTSPFFESEPAYGLISPTECSRSDTVTLEATLWELPLSLLGTLPLEPSATRPKGHHGIRKFKLPRGENRHMEDHQGTAMWVKSSRIFQPSHSWMKPSEWSSQHHVQQNSPAKLCLNSRPTNHEQIKQMLF